jgi:hypothetical protein
MALAKGFALDIPWRPAGQGWVARCSCRDPRHAIRVAFWDRTNTRLIIEQRRRVEGLHRADLIPSSLMSGHHSQHSRAAVVLQSFSCPQFGRVKPTQAPRNSSRVLEVTS